MRSIEAEVYERFWSKVAKAVDDGCWTWLAGKGNGYGSFSVNGVSLLAHRVAYENLVGPIPEGLHIDHLCRNRSCVNPAHLEPVTPGENVLRGTSPSAHYARQTHCSNGHEFTPENTYMVKSSGARQCRECCRQRTFVYGMKRICCVVCDKELLRGNMHRHMRQMHGVRP